MQTHMHMPIRKHIFANTYKYTNTPTRTHINAQKYI